MRTEIKIFSSKISIQLTENNSIDEEWYLWKLAVDKENKIQKELFTSREMLILDYGNRARNNDNIDELKKVCIESMGFRDIILSMEGWNEKELICSDNLGNELYLENFERKSYDNRLMQINLLIQTIEEKKAYLESLENEKAQLSEDVNLKRKKKEKVRRKFDEFLIDCDNNKAIEKLKSLLNEQTSTKSYLTVVFALKSLKHLAPIDNRAEFCDALRVQFGYDESNAAFNYLYVKQTTPPSDKVTPIQESDIKDMAELLSDISRPPSKDFLKIK